MHSFQQHQGPDADANASAYPFHRQCQWSRSGRCPRWFPPSPIATPLGTPSRPAGPCPATPLPPDGLRSATSNRSPIPLQVTHAALVVTPSIQPRQRQTQTQLQPAQPLLHQRSQLHRPWAYIYIRSNFPASLLPLQSVTAVASRQSRRHEHEHAVGPAPRASAEGSFAARRAASFASASEGTQHLSFDRPLRLEETPRRPIVARDRGREHTELGYDGSGSQGGGGKAGIRFGRDLRRSSSERRSEFVVFTTGL